MELCCDYTYIISGETKMQKCNVSCSKLRQTQIATEFDSTVPTLTAEFANTIES